jgi:hypothetical protein
MQPQLSDWLTGRALHNPAQPQPQKRPFPAAPTLKSGGVLFTSSTAAGAYYITHNETGGGVAKVHYKNGRFPTPALGLAAGNIPQN